MRQVYLGDKLDFDRSSTPSEPGLVYPVFNVDDPNGEPLKVKAEISDYSDTFVPLREIHLVYLTDATATLSPEELISTDGLIRVSMDVSNIKGQTVVLEVPGLPNGAVSIQAVLVAGRD